MHHLLDPASSESLKTWLAERGAPKYRASQIQSWLFGRRVTSFGDMANLPQKLQQALAEDFQLFTSEIVDHRTAKDGTEKLLLQWPDGGQIECVLLRDGPRRTICISSQVGCAMGCVFCASGLDGVQRNLTAGEIVEQMLRLQALLDPEERLSYVVVMGMGEPMSNLDNVLPALDMASSKAGLGIGARRITISTVGLPQGIDQLAKINCRYNLAVSLHAPNDELRNQLLPINQTTGLAEILRATDGYFDVSGRRLTYEYVLLAGINDQPEHAKALAELLGHRTAMVNLIPYNPVAGLPYKSPPPRIVARFLETLEQAGLEVQLRRRKGGRIDAACGQLRRAKKPPTSSGK